MFARFTEPLHKSVPSLSIPIVHNCSLKMDCGNIRRRRLYKFLPHYVMLLIDKPFCKQSRQCSPKQHDSLSNFAPTYLEREANKMCLIGSFDQSARGSDYDSGCISTNLKVTPCSYQDGGVLGFVFSSVTTHLF